MEKKWGRKLFLGFIALVLGLTLLVSGTVKTQARTAVIDPQNQDDALSIARAIRDGGEYEYEQDGVSYYFYYDPFVAFDAGVDKVASWVQKADLEQKSIVIPGASTNAAGDSSSNPVTSLAAAGKYLKQKYLNRTASFKMYTSEVYTWDELHFEWGKYTEGGSSQEGDALFWNPLNISASRKSLGNSIYEYSITPKYKTTLAQENTYTKEVSAALSSLNLSDLSTEAKIRKIHDYICDHVNYDHVNVGDADGHPLIYSGYGALHNGSAVCTGYALLFYRMCLDAGIPNRFIAGYTGDTYNQSEGYHAWNIVKIDGKYYNIDTTWDGQEEPTYHTWYLRSDADFSGHYRREDYGYASSDFYSKFPMSSTSFRKRITTLVGRSYASSGCMNLNWEEDGGNVTYTIYRSSDGSSFSEIATTNAKGGHWSEKTANLTYGQTYWYKIRPYDNGNLGWGQDSNVVSMTAVEQNEFYISGTNDITSGYPKVTWDEISDVSGFYVFRKLPTESSYTYVATVTTNYYLDKDVTKGESYMYVVCPVDTMGGQGYRYNEVTIVAKPAQPKIALVGDSDAPSIKVTWASIKDASYYEIYREDDYSSSQYIGTSYSLSYVDTSVSTWTNYSYKVRAVTSNGTQGAFSDSKSLYLYPKPQINTQPEDASVPIGVQASFSVSASGNEMAYQWYYRTSSSGSWQKSTSDYAHDSAFIVPASSVVKARNGYQYKCVIKNSGGSVTTNIVTLHVTKPKITTQPASKTVDAETTVSFKVAAQGTGLTYQWYYRTSSTGTWQKSTSSTAKSSTFSIPAANVTKARSGYQYRCVVTNDMGSTTSNAATLTVKAPTIKTHPADVTTEPETQVSFTVVASGGNLTYQWYYKSPSTGKWAKCTSASAATKTYTIPASSVNSAHNGYKYLCIVTNGGGSTTSNAATLTVSKPKITEQPTSVTTEPETQVSFKVVGSGKNLKYQWYYRTSSSGTWAKSTSSYAKSATFVIPASSVVGSRSGYQYRCVVSNAGGSVTSNTVTLTVNKPKITTQPTSVTTEPETQVSFTVAGSGKNLKYQWYYKSPSTGKWAKCTSDSATTRTYTIPASSVNGAHNGYKYLCIISNGGGSVTSSAATLTVNKPKITAQPTSVTTDPDTQVSFKVAGSGKNITYQWYYRTSSTGTWVKSTSSYAKSATFVIPASSVVGSRNGYQYRCVISNKGGSVTSSAATLTVNKPKITTQPTSVTTEPETQVSFKIAGSGKDITYQWYYRTSSSGTWSKSTSSTAKKATFVIEADKVTKDRSGYQYRCVISNKGGSVTSNTVTLTVKKPSITTQPSSKKVEEGTAVSFKVAASGKNVTYQWYYRTSSTGTWVKSTAADAKSATYSIAASSVTKARNGYQYRCVITNKGGTVTSSTATLTVTYAKPEIISQPKSKTVSAGTKVSFTVTASGKNKTYQWYYRTSSTGTWQKSTAACAKSATYTIDASSVTKSRSGYQYRCVVTNEGGSVTSATVTLTVQ